MADTPAPKPFALPPHPDRDGGSWTLNTDGTYSPADAATAARVVPPAPPADEPGEEA